MTTSNGSTDQVILRAEGIQFSYGKNLILEDITFEAYAGEFICLVGPSGAGKTTLLKCLAGLHSPTHGTLKFEGEEVTGPPQNMTVVFQDYSRSLMPWLTAYANIELPLKSAGMGAAERAERVSEALAEVGLGAAAQKYPWELSGGMQQRIAIARALAYRPSMIIMDEPFASVDAQTRADLEDLVLKVKRDLGISIILVTHDIDEAVYLSDRVLVLSGSPASVTRDMTIELPQLRDQISTKALPEFAKHRGEIYSLVKKAVAQV